VVKSGPPDPPQNRLVCGDNLAWMATLPDGCCELIYIDPPFAIGDSGNSANLPAFQTFLRPRLVEMHGLLSPQGSLYVHLDWRSIHYVKVALDEIFGAERLGRRWRGRDLNPDAVALCERGLAAACTETQAS